MAIKRIDNCGPKGCAIKAPAGARIAVQFPGFNYTSGSARGKGEKGKTLPCATARKTCPVQLIFDRGQPKLRFCTSKGKPGHTVAVNSAKEAQAVAAKACACWKKNGKSFASCEISSAGLGRARRKGARR